MAVTREQLFDEVWAEPMTKVAARYSVSSSFLARVCERMNVPRPDRGYWAKLQVGKAPKKPRLPEPQAGDELEWSRDGEPRRVPRPLPRPPQPPPAETADTPISDTPSAKRARTGTHPVIEASREHIASGKENSSGYLRPTKRRLVDVFVSLATLDRALKVLNELFFALEARGHRVSFAPWDGRFVRLAISERSDRRRAGYGWESWTPDRPTIVSVGTVAIGLTLVELSHEAEVRYVGDKWVPISQLPPEPRRTRGARQYWDAPTRHHVPSGKMCLRATSPYPGTDWQQEWCETRRGEPHSKIDTIVSVLEAGAVTIAKLVGDAERKAELQRRELEAEAERWRREEVERQRLEGLKKSREHLLALVGDWATAMQIEGFFRDVEQRAAVLPEVERGQLAEQVGRARELVGGVDALKRFLQWRPPE